MSKSLVMRYKKELRTTTYLMELVDVLKRVAASQFQSLSQSQAERTSISSRLALEDFFRLMPPEQFRHPFVEKPAPPLGLVIVTSDEGFLGGLNTAVIRKALSARGGQEAELIVLGERGRIYLEDLNERITHFPGVGEHISSEKVERLRDYIVRQYLQRKFASVLVFYPRSFSFTHQEVDSLQLLPYERLSQIPDAAPLASTQAILEPSAYSIIEYLIKLWLTGKINEIFWQSRLSELAARAMHLEGSLQELREQKKKLTLQYFRRLHEVTDTSIRESYAGLVTRKKEVVGSHT